MRISLQVLVALTFITSCSAPRYTYHFDKYKTKSVQKNDPMSNALEANAGNFSTQQILVASTSGEITVHPDSGLHRISKTEQNPKTFFPKLNGVYEDDLRKIRDVLKEKKRSSHTVHNGTEKRNRTAKIGFVLSLAAMIGGIVGFATQNWVIIAFFFIPWVVGFILSVIGLKSEKWKLALTGLIMSVIFFLAWYISTNGFM